MIALLLLGCSEGQLGAPQSRALPMPEVTWHGDVEPFFRQNCAHCHDAGGLAPEWIFDPDAVAAQSDYVLARLDSDMPPPASDPDCRDYQDREHLWVEPEQRELLRRWLEEGAPRGAPGQGEGAERLLHLDDVDVTWGLPAPYQLPVTPDANSYRCFVIDPGLDETTYITAYDFRPGNPEVTHHAVLFADPTGDPSATYGAGPGLDEFDCREDFLADGWSFLHGWAPGMTPTVFPEGLGMRVDPGTKLVLQMHYFAEGADPPTDQSTYGLRLAAEVEKPVTMLPPGPTSFRIPPGDEEYTARFNFTNSYVDIYIHGVFPHMHRLGSSYAAAIRHADGTEDCLVRGDWDFENQMTYMYDEPVRFEIGDSWRSSCTWDNSEGEGAVGFGESTDQEMCFFFSYVTFF